MIPSPLTLNQQPVVSRLNKRIYWAGGIGLGLICLAFWSSLTKRTESRPVPEPMTVAKKELPDVLKQDPPAPQPVPVPTPQPMIQQPQQQMYRPAPQPRVATPKPPKQPKQESEKEKTLREAMTASPLVTRGEGHNPQTLEIGKQIVASQYTVDGTLQPRQSDFVLTAGTSIPASLITGINSMLPGDVFALITQNIYDSVKQTHLLIPQGARLQGKYANEVAQGQDRIFLQWDRIIYPDGSSLILGGMNGADTEGKSGLADRVNNHWGQMFGRALMFSAISAGIGITQNGLGGSRYYDPYSPGDAATAAVGREFGRVANESVRRGGQIPPTIEIRPGSTFLVIVNKDIVFTNPYNPSQEEK